MKHIVKQRLLFARQKKHLQGSCGSTITVFGILAVICAYTAKDIWLSLIGAMLIASDPLQPSDAIVALAGDRYRVDYASELLHKHYAEMFIITDMRMIWHGKEDPPGTYAKQIMEQVLMDCVPKNRIINAPGTAATTFQEAQSIRLLAEEYHWHTIIVVTSPYHTRRARAILREVFRDSEIRVTVRPVQPHWYTPETWWTEERGRQITWVEYQKFALYLLGYHKLWP